MKKIVYSIVLIALVFQTGFLSNMRASAQGIETETPTPTLEPTKPPEPTATETASPVPPTAEPPLPTETPIPTETPLSIATVSPVEEIALTLSSSPNVIRRGAELTVEWEIQGLKEVARGTILRFHLPAEVTPVDTGTGKWDKEAGTLDVEIAELKGSLGFNVGKKAVSPLTITAELLLEEKPLAKAELSLLDPDETLVTSKGGKAIGLKGRIEATFPEGALGETVKVAIQKPSKESLPIESLSGSPFEIIAVSEKTKLEVDRFKKPIEIVAHYDEGLQNGNEENLILYWYDPTDGQWKFPLSQRVDTENNVIIATTDHFTVFDTYNSNWQGAETPTMESFQTSQFTGAASFSMPIKVPPGPGGFQPSLALSYSSMTADAASNFSQASWVGMGWSLDTSYIEKNTNGTEGWDENGNPKNDDDTFSFNLNGVSSTLYRDPASGQYRSANENFFRFKYDPTARSWTVWDKTGTQYVFSHLSERFAFHLAECAYVKYPWRWSLTTVRNKFGQEIVYTYTTETKSFGYTNCDGNFRVVNSETWVYPRSIEYTKDGNGRNRYRIFFDRIEENETAKNPRKDLKTVWTLPSLITYEAFQRSLLEAILVQQDADGNGTFETLIRKYQFSYCQAANCSIFPKLVWGAGGRTPTLISVQEFGLGGTESLPAYTFTYGDDMHLTSASNGYGAAITYKYNNSDNAQAPDNAWHETDGGNPLKFDSSLTGWTGCVTPHYEDGHVSGADICGLAQNTAVDSYQPGRWYIVKARVRSSVSGASPQVRLGYAYKENGVLSPDYLDPAITLPSDRSWKTIVSQPFFLPVNATKIIPEIKSSNGFTNVRWYYLVPLPTYSRVTSRTITVNSIPYTSTYAYYGAVTNRPSISAAAAGPRPYVEPYTEFRGHSRVEETNPYGGKTITKFYRNDIYAGRAYEVTVEDGSGKIIQKSTTTYDFQEWPAATLRTEKCDVITECDQPYDTLYIRWVKTLSESKSIYSNTPNAAVATTTTNYNTYDAYGNLTQATLSGTGIETLTTYTDYSPNVSNTIYLVGLPARTYIKNEAGAILALSMNIYDNAATYDTPPVAGKLKATRTLISGNANNGQYSQTSYWYDEYGNINQQRVWTNYGTDSSNPSGGAQTTNMVYDSEYHIFPISVTNALEQTTTINYDYNNDGTNDFILGVPTRETGPNGTATKVQAEYDTFGRLTKLVRPGDTFASPTLGISYNDANPFTVTLAQKINDTQNFVIVRRYDGMGRPTLVTTNGSTKVSYTYGFENGARVDKQSMPYTSAAADWVKTEYDSLARPVTVTAPDGTFTSYAYDGLRTEVTDANGNATTSVSDILGRTRSVTPPTGPNVVFDYDPLGNLKTATRAGATVSMNYDKAGRKISMSDPDMGAWSYGYDALGNLTTQTDARGCVTTLQYDVLNRLTNKSYSNCPQGVAATPNVQYYYDGQSFTFDGTVYGSSPYAIGQRTGMVAGSTASAWTYDVRGRLKSETKDFAGSSSFTTQWTYNSADLPTSLTYPDSETVITNYDNRMLIANVAGTTTYASSFLYDSANRLTGFTLGNNLGQRLYYKDWNVQGGGRLDMTVSGTGTYTEANRSFTTTLQKSAYSYDSIGNITSIYDSMWGETQTFGYDSLNRLTSASATGGLADYNETYQYDPATGNLVNKNGLVLNYPTDGTRPHAVTSAGGNTYGYDQNGNQVTRVIGGQTVTLGYDAENRMVSVSGTNLAASFTYNGDGQRVKSVVNGETILFAGGHYELNSTTGEVSKYYFAGASRIAVRKYIVPQTTTLTYLVGDHLGSTSLAVDASTGDVIETRYKPWGEVRYTTPNATLPTRYTFTGQYSHMSDDATDLGNAGFGLMFYNARWYDPVTGRFAQADTIVSGGVQGLDRYAYVNNSPVNYVDPSGHFACEDSFTEEECKQREYATRFHPLLTFETSGNENFTQKEKDALLADAKDVAQALANEMNSACNKVAEMEGTECDGISPTDAFYKVYGGPVTVRRVTGTCNCWAEFKHDDPNNLYIAVYSNTTSQIILDHPRLLVHELGHYFLWQAKNVIHGSLGGRNGFYGDYFTWQFGIGTDDNSVQREIFADMFVGWVYGKWEVDQSRASGFSVNGENKSAYMDKYMPLMINKAIGR